MTLINAKAQIIVTPRDFETVSILTSEVPSLILCLEFCLEVHIHNLRPTKCVVINITAQPKSPQFGIVQFKFHI